MAAAIGGDAHGELGRTLRPKGKDVDSTHPGALTEIERPGEIAWSNAALLAAVNAAGCGVYTIDVLSEQVVLSQRLRAILGLPVDQDAAVGLTDLRALVHPDDRDRFEAYLIYAHALPEGERYQQAFRIVRPDGQVRRVQDIGTCEFGGRGESRQVTRVMGVILDITDWTHVDGASGDHASSVLSASPVVVFSQDLELRYTWVREQSTWGLQPREIVGSTDSKIFGSEQAGRLESLKREVLATREPRRRELCLTHDGIEGWYDLTVSPQYDVAGAVIGVICSAVDITERKHSEDMLRERSERLEFLTEASAALLASDDPEAFIDAIFRRLSALVGVDVYVHYALSQEQSLLELAAYDGLTDEQRESLACQHLGSALCGTVAQTRRPMVIAEDAAATDPHTRQMRALGLRAYVCHPLIARGELFGTLAFGTASASAFSDDAVDLLRSVNDLLALAIARHQAEQSLREADRRKDEFLATLAHELRNPLAAICSGVDLLGMATDDADTIAFARAVMDRQVQQLTRLVDDLLEISRINHGRLELRVDRVDLLTVIESALDSVRGVIEDSGHELTVELPEGPIPLQGDPARLSQVFANLLGNAVKYTPDGGHIALRVVRHPSTISVSVSDDGQGIEPERLASIFDPFSSYGQVAEAQPGLGLGLTLAKVLVDMHRGRIQVRSPGPGRGSEFIVTLPIRGGTEAAGSLTDPRRGPPTVAAAAPPYRVLIIDDNEGAARLLARLIERLGHDARVAVDGLTGVDAAASYRPHLILLDIGLPLLDGYEVARRIRKLPSGAGAMLVALTGWGRARDKRRALESGFDDHFAKPLTVPQIQGLLQQVEATQPVVELYGAELPRA